MAWPYVPAIAFAGVLLATATRLTRPWETRWARIALLAAVAGTAWVLAYLATSP